MIRARSGGDDKYFVNAESALRFCFEIKKERSRRDSLRRLLSKLPFVNTYRTFCIVPTPEIKRVFEGLTAIAIRPPYSSFQLVIMNPPWRKDKYS